MPSPLQTLKITIYIYSVRNHSLHIKFHPCYSTICKMAGGKHQKKTMLRRYSKEEVLQAILDLDTDSCDTISSASSNEIPCEDIPSSNEHNTHEIDDRQNTPHFPIESSPKVFTQLENIASTSPVSHVDLEFTSSGEITSSPSQPQSDSSTTSYGKYSSTDTEYPNSSPTFPSDDRKKTSLKKRQFTFITLFPFPETWVKVITDKKKQQRKIQHMHAGPSGTLQSESTGGHSGMNKTWQKVMRRYYWKGMTDDIHEFVRTCDRCQHKKMIKLQKTQVSMKSIPIPHKNIWTSRHRSHSDGGISRIQIFINIL